MNVMRIAISTVTDDRDQRDLILLKKKSRINAKGAKNAKILQVAFKHFPSPANYIGSCRLGYE